MDDDGIDASAEGSLYDEEAYAEPVVPSDGASAEGCVSHIGKCVREPAASYCH